MKKWEAEKNGYTCNDCYFSMQNCHDMSICCEDETGLCDWFEEMPKRGRWIPCSERLPEDDTLMLVNYIDNRPDAADIWIGWHEMENVWYIDGEEHSEEQGNEVVAWMPLPEPWMGK